MELNELYNAIAFSPDTALSQDIGESDTIIYVDDVSVFPPGPGLATIGVDEGAETIKYGTVTENALSGCERGIEGTAKAWTTGEKIARNFTAKDWNDLVANIATIVAKILGLTAAEVGAVASGLETIKTISDADNIRTSGHYLFLDENGEMGQKGYLYDLYVSTQIYSNSYSITQTLIRTYYNVEGVSVRVRSYYAVGGWSAWKDIGGDFKSDGSVPIIGQIMLKDTSGKMGRVFGNQFGAYLCGGDNTEPQRQLVVVNPSNTTLPKDLAHSLILADSADGTTWKETCYIHGTHNKTTVIYTGNASAVERVIPTGGIGKVVVISNPQYTAILHQYGGVVFDILDKSNFVMYNKTNTSGAPYAYFDGASVHLVGITDSINANGYGFEIIVI